MEYFETLTGVILIAIAFQYQQPIIILAAIIGFAVYTRSLGTLAVLLAVTALLYTFSTSYGFNSILIPVMIALVILAIISWITRRQQRAGMDFSSLEGLGGEGYGGFSGGGLGPGGY